MSTSATAHAVATSAAAARALLQSMSELVVDDDTAEIIIDTETDLSEAIAQAVDRIADLEAHSEAIKARIMELTDRRSRFAANIDALRRSIQSAMESVEIRKLELPMATIGLRAVPRGIVIVDEAAIPAVYMHQPPPVPNKKAIKAALDEGHTVAGAELSNGGQTVSIRRG